MNPSTLLEETLAAHGGRQRWQSVNVINAAFSSGGLAFTSHMQPFSLKGLQLSLQPHARQVTLIDYGRKGWRGTWTPSHVQIVDDQGALIAQRHHPRANFSRFGKQWHWDKLDLLYFAGYALWNYLSFPFLLATADVTTEETMDSTGAPAALRQLTARFSDAVPTHSSIQTFHIGPDGLLVRHDYTADVIGHWATAANFCLASQQVSGLRFYTRRRVVPRLGGKIVLPGPTLVWIEIDDLSVHTHDRPAP